MPQASEQSRPAASAKADLRKTMRALRENLAPQKALCLSRQAEQHLLASSCWQQARSVALYVALKGELSTADLLQAAWQQGKLLWLPRVRRHETGTMDFALCGGEQQLRPGPCGLMEPLDALPGLGAEDAGDTFVPDLLILPGVAFDRGGGRLGFGGGYYDRFLNSGLRCPRVGLCYGFQLVEALPLEPWDAKVDYLCTEEGLVCL